MESSKKRKTDRPRFSNRLFFLGIAIGIIAYFAGGVIWPPSIVLRFTGLELVLSNAFYLFETLAFGWGISFLIWMLPRVEILRKERWLNFNAAALSVGWLLLSWWPHDRLHLTNYESVHSFLYIEYGFHIPTIVAIFIVAYYFFRFLEAYGGMRIRKK
jgi:hypothetical protein